MNMNTAAVMKLLKVSEALASEVVSNMQIDFSECTTRAFNQEARTTLLVMKELATRSPKCPT
jgi:hypothetical protein